MKTADAIAEILQARGRRVGDRLSGQPHPRARRPGRHPPDHRAPGAHRPAHGRRDLAGDPRPARSASSHAARPRHRERLWRRRPGLQRIGADPRHADGLCAAASPGCSRNYNASLQHAGHHQVGRAADLGRARSPNVMRRAFTRLRSGRGGPVLVEMPIDVWNEEIASPRLHAGPQLRTGPDPEAVREAAAMLVAAERPVIYAGQGVHWAEAWDELQRAGRAARDPGLHQPRGQERVPRDAPARARLGRPRHPADGPPLPRRGRSDPRHRLQLHRDQLRRGDADGQTIIHATLDPMDINKDVPVRAGRARRRQARPCAALIEEVAGSRGTTARDRPAGRREIARRPRSLARATGCPS